MTILIDPPNAAGHGRLWSHLASDTSFDELHEFALGFGVPSRGFDRDHYDVPSEWYDRVVAAGAVPVSSRELIIRLRAAGLRRRKSEALRPRKPGPLAAAPAHAGGRRRRRHRGAGRAGRGRADRRRPDRAALLGARGPRAPAGRHRAALLAGRLRRGPRRRPRRLPGWTPTSPRSGACAAGTAPSASSTCSTGTRWPRPPRSCWSASPTSPPCTRRSPPGSASPPCSGRC